MSRNFDFTKMRNIKSFLIKMNRSFRPIAGIAKIPYSIQLLIQGAGQLPDFFYIRIYSMVTVCRQLHHTKYFRVI